MHHTRLGILTVVDTADRYGIQRLKQEGKKLSPQVKVEEIYLAYSSLTINSKGSLRFQYQKNKFVLPPVILSRIGAIEPSFGLYVLNHLSKLPDVKVVNRIEGVSIARDKFRTLQLLAESEYTVPKSLLLGQGVDLEWAIKQVGGFPAILKLNKGTWGIGVMLVESMGGAKSVFETLSKLNQKVMIQQYLSSETGIDYRLFVLGGKYLIGMKRVARNPHEFRANIAQGAKGYKFDPPAELKERAEAIAQLMRLDLAGIDFVYNNKLGFVPIEVNAASQFEALEKATGINVAKAIIEYCVKE